MDHKKLKNFGDHKVHKIFQEKITTHLKNPQIIKYVRIQGFIILDQKWFADQTL